MGHFKTLHYAKLTYQSCQKLKLPRHLKDQLLRASSSVALNLAEGRGRQSINEQRHFFSIAMGSLREVQVILDLAELGKSDSYLLADITGAHLYKLICNLKSP